MKIEEKDGMFSLTHKIMAQIVKEEDEYMINMIEEYVKAEQHKGNFVSAKLIPEGQLKHILNLGMMAFANIHNTTINPDELFAQEQYIEYLRRELSNCEKENRRLREMLNEQSCMGGDIYE